MLQLAINLLQKENKCSAKLLADMVSNYFQWFPYKEEANSDKAIASLVVPSPMPLYYKAF